MAERIRRVGVAASAFALTLFAADACFRPAYAEGEQEEIGFDDVEEADATADRSLKDMVHISGLFDINLEMTNLSGDGEKEDNFRNYHHFVFLNVTPDDRIRFQAEIIDLFFYEMSYKLTPSVEMKAGKIWVPFGNSPFHHFYGGVQGDPFSGRLVPNVWTELGADVNYTVLKSADGAMSLTGDTYVIRGFEGTEGSVLDLSQGGKDDVFAYGQRVMASCYSNKFVLSGSALYSQWGPDNDNDVLLWGADLDLGYGLIDAPFLRDLSFRGAVARAEVKDPELVDPAFNDDGWYYKYGDFGEISFGHWRPQLTLKFRYGSYIDFDDVVTGQDSHAFNASAVHRRGGASLWAEYFWMYEEVDEVDNDFLRLRMVLEF